MATSRHAVLGRVRAKAFLGALAVGLASGLVAAHAAGGGWLKAGASGVLLVALGGNVGGFAGMFARGLWLRLRGAGPDERAYSTEGVLVLSTYGGFLGLVAALVAGAGGAAHLLAGAGALAGGAGASLLGRGMFLLLDMLALDGMDDASRDRAVRRAVEDSRAAMLPPDGDGPDGPTGAGGGGGGSGAP
ncbi:hypothetical protein [Desulfocurvus vexinensis]|uniref:hypothetical protein n=1 Tax=Desulfocurvus vexinensis TaxID=399548 RepID=UPI00048F27F2|nr:hypothetical protein [Desulfocurvus vexinensis]